MRSARYWTVILLLAVTALLLHSRGDTDRVPPSEPLSQFPITINGWTGQDFPIGEDVLAVLGKGDFLNRVYTKDAGAAKVADIDGGMEAISAPVSLFIGYFPTQRTGQSIHSPQNCLPGAGWSFDSSHYVYITATDGRKYHVGEYVISNGTTRQFVLYWYQAHGRSIANEYAAKLYMISDAIRLDRTDGALVRVITPIVPGEETAVARARAVRFTANVASLLPAFIPD